MNTAVSLWVKASLLVAPYSPGDALQTLDMEQVSNASKTIYR